MRRGRSPMRIERRAHLLGRTAEGRSLGRRSGRAMFQIMGVFAEFERAMIRERLNAGGIAMAAGIGNSGAPVAHSIFPPINRRRWAFSAIFSYPTAISSIMRLASESVSCFASPWASSARSCQCFTSFRSSNGDRAIGRRAHARPRRAADMRIMSAKSYAVRRNSAARTRLRNWSRVSIGLGFATT